MQRTVTASLHSGKRQSGLHECVLTLLCLLRCFLTLLSQVRKSAHPNPVIEFFDDIDMASVELEEILADGPVVRNVAKAAFFSQKVMAGSEEKEDSGVFELPSWV
ncbi:hypothetical protein BDZ97DRAFT_1843910 [Flammula alnicola]|nr:hypothetical protein BDZ97DRAFT_1843910 [Flammula alnicola]